MGNPYGAGGYYQPQAVGMSSSPTSFAKPGMKYTPGGGFGPKEQAAGYYGGDETVARDLMSFSGQGPIGINKNRSSVGGGGFYGQPGAAGFNKLQSTIDPLEFSGGYLTTKNPSMPGTAQWEPFQVFDVKSAADKLSGFNYGDTLSNWQDVSKTFQDVYNNYSDWSADVAKQQQNPYARRGLQQGVAPSPIEISGPGFNGSLDQTPMQQSADYLSNWLSDYNKTTEDYLQSAYADAYNRYYNRGYFG